MYLVDNNIWLERLLGQEKSGIGGKFLDHVSSDHLFISDFVLHFIDIILSRLNRRDSFLQFIEVCISSTMKIEPIEATLIRTHRKHRRIIFITLRATANRHEWLAPFFR